MKARKGIWLFDFDQIKYEHPFHYVAYVVLGLGAIVLGSALAWAFYGRWNHDSVADLALALIVPAAMVAFGIMLFPLGLFYFIRRSKGEAVDIWSAETSDARDEHHGPDSR